MKIANLLEEHESDLCPASLAWTLSNPFRRILHSPEKILSAYIQPGQVAADFGCGPGFFTLPLCQLTGPNGKVYAVDVQNDMLEMVKARARKAGVEPQLRPVLVDSESFELPEPIEFGMAFWMIHEVRDQKAFIDTVYRSINPGGSFLLVEPRLHVSGEHFQAEVDLAQAAGFSKPQTIQIAISRAVLFVKPIA